MGEGQVCGRRGKVEEKEARGKEQGERAKEERKGKAKDGHWVIIKIPF